MTSVRSESSAPSGSLDQPPAVKPKVCTFIRRPPCDGGIGLLLLLAYQCRAANEKELHGF
jgi:hypothetical protein